MRSSFDEIDKIIASLQKIYLTTLSERDNDATIVHKILCEKKAQREIMREEMERAHLKEPEEKEQQRFEEVKEFAPKAINEFILLKGVTLRGKEKVPLNKITLMSLEENELTKISEMERVPQLQNLHLNRNHIYMIENLSHLSKLKVLKLECNQIVKIEGLQGLTNLEQLYLGENHISKFEGLTHNRKLHIINISNQKSKYEMKFDEQTCHALAYSLQVFHCDNNRVRDLRHFSCFKVLSTLYLKGNMLGDMEELSDPFGGMERLKNMDFRNNPLCSLPKYRDYVVILCKNLEQLDNKEILDNEREYQVKHKMQIREKNEQSKTSYEKLKPNFQKRRSL